MSDTYPHESIADRREQRRSQMIAAGTAPAAPAPLVPITTDIPASIRQELKVALAVHNVKLQDAVAEALTLWLATTKDAREGLTRVDAAEQRAATVAHLGEHCLAQPGDCTGTKNLRGLLSQALNLLLTEESRA